MRALSWPGRKAGPHGWTLTEEEETHKGKGGKLMTLKDHCLDTIRPHNMWWEIHRSSPMFTTVLNRRAITRDAGLEEHKAVHPSAVGDVGEHIKCNLVNSWANKGCSASGQPPPRDHPGRSQNHQDCFFTVVHVPFFSSWSSTSSVKGVYASASWMFIFLSAKFFFIYLKQQQQKKSNSCYHSNSNKIGKVFSSIFSADKKMIWCFVFFVYFQSLFTYSDWKWPDLVTAATPTTSG